MSVTYLSSEDNRVFLSIAIVLYVGFRQESPVQTQHKGLFSCTENIMI